MRPADLRSQRAVEIVPEVVDMLDANAKPQQRWRKVFLTGDAGAALYCGLDAQVASVIAFA
jgi:hypothetical protein